MEGPSSSNTGGNPQEAATLGAATRVEGIQGVADILGAGDIRAAGIPGVATRVEGILEAIPEGAVGEVILGAEAEDPLGDEELQRRALKTTRKCSR